MKKLSYDRPEPTLELKDEPYDEVKPAESFCVNLPRETDLVAEYRAGEPTRETSLIFVVSGGEKRERDYLLELVRTRNNSYRKCVNVVFTSPANDTSRHRGSSPDDILEYWGDIFDKDSKMLKTEEWEGTLEENDSVYFLTDLDHFRKSLEKILSLPPQATPPPYQWIISNPCFEIWLYYSYCDDDPNKTLQALKPLDEHKRPRILKTLCNSLYSGGMNPKEAFNNIERAIENAERYGSYDKNRIPQLFSTDMTIFAKKVWEYIRIEFPKKQKERAERIQSFKKNLNQWGHLNSSSERVKL